MSDLIDINIKFALKEWSRKFTSKKKLTVNQLESRIMTNLSNFFKQCNSNNSNIMLIERVNNSPIDNNNMSITLNLDSIIDNMLDDMEAEKKDNKVFYNSFVGKLNISKTEKFEIIHNKSNIKKQGYEELNVIDYNKIEMSNVDQLNEKTISRYETKIRINNLPYVMMPFNLFNEQHNLEEIMRIREPEIQSIYGRTLKDDKYGFSLIFHSIDDAYSLEEKISRALTEKTFNENKKWLILLDICKLLDFLNKKGIYYSNLTPKNILIDSKGKVYLKFAGFFNLEDTVYSAPELVNRKLVNPTLSLSPNYDVYSLGCIIYYIFTGIHPYNGDLQLYKQNLKNNKSLLEFQKTLSNLNLTKLIKACCSFDRENRITLFKANIYIILNNQSFFQGFIECINEDVSNQESISRSNSLSSSGSEAKTIHNPLSRRISNKVNFNNKVEVYEIIHEKYRVDNKNIKLDVKDIRFQKDVTFCNKCSLKNTINNCKTCLLKFCGTCLVKCNICEESKCFNCCTKLTNCFSTCSNNICNGCLDQYKGGIKLINKKFYIGNVCKEIHCKECVEVKYCNICANFCCFKCVKFCEECLQIICTNCHDIYSNSKERLAYKTIKCQHNINIFLGCNKGKLVNFDMYNKTILTEYNIHDGNVRNHITSLIRLEEKFITTSYDGEIKVWKDHNFESTFLEIDNDGSQISQGIVVGNDKIAVVGWNNKTAMMIDINKDEDEITKEMTVNSMLTSVCQLSKSVILLGGYDKSIIYFWDFEKNLIIHNLLAHENCVNNIIKLKYLDSFVTSGEDKLIKIWDSNFIKSSSISNLEIVQNYVCAIKEHLDGRLVFSSKDYTIKLYDIKSNSNVSLKQHSNFVYDYLSLDDYNLISISKDSTIVYWDLRKNAMFDSFKFDNYYPTRLLNFYDF